MLIEKKIAMKTAEAICKLYGSEIGVDSVTVQKTIPLYRDNADLTVVVFPFTKISISCECMLSTDIQYIFSNFKFFLFHFLLLNKINE